MSTILELDKQELKSISGGTSDLIPYLAGKAAGGAVMYAGYKSTKGLALGNMIWPIIGCLFLMKEAVAAKVTSGFQDADVNGSTAKSEL